MLTPEFIDEIPNKISALMFDMENWTIQRIAFSISKNAELSASAEYQLLRLAELNRFDADYKKKLAELARKTEAEIDRIFAEAAEHSYSYDKRLFELKNIPFVPLAENKALQQLVYAASEQLKGEMKTLTNSRALKMINPYGNAVTIPKFYSNTLDSVTMQVASGVTSYDEAVRRAVKGMAQNGITVVHYDKNGKKLNRRIETVARMNVLMGVSNMANEITLNNMDILGLDVVETTAHWSARPSHVPWQGKRFSFGKSARDKYRADKKPNNGLNNSADSDTINTGGISGALNPNSREALNHAEQYYESVRKMTTDVNRIAANTGYDTEYIAKAKEHLFMKKHNLGDNIIKRFDPDYEIAQSWQRLIDGKSIRQHDYVLLKHEYAEQDYMSQGYTQQQAHDMANTQFNYQKALQER